LTCGKAVHNGGSTWQKSPFAVNERDKEEGAVSHNPLLRHIPMIRRPPTRLHLLSFPIPHKSTKLDTRPSTYGPLGNISDSRYSS
jgi:hypothetical protein